MRHGKKHSCAIKKSGKSVSPQRLSAPGGGDNTVVGGHHYQNLHRHILRELLAPAQYWGNEIVKEALPVLAPVALILCLQFSCQESIEGVHQVQSLPPPNPWRCRCSEFWHVYACK